MLMVWKLLSTERLTQRTAEGFSRLKGRRTRASSAVLTSAPVRG
jgi:hypothetical protein